MRPWIAEAANIKIKDGTNSKKYLEDTLHINNRVEEFLSNDNKNFISATKGFGKTYLLKLKSKRVRDQKTGAIYIPRSELVDRVGSNSMPSLSYEIYNQYNDVEVHELLWRYSFVLSVVCNSKDILNSVQRLENIPEKLLPKEVNYAIVQDIYIQLLNDYSLFRDIRYGRFYNDIERIVRNSQEGVYIFVDNVDEFYDNMQFIYTDDIWYHSQIALLRAVTKLTSQINHIHIYATIRKKVLEQLKKEDILYAQYKDSIVELIYTKDDLKKIFVNNIKIEQKSNLVKPQKTNKNNNSSDDYLEAFTGFVNIENRWINNIKENIFDYIYRHTLGRPRDLMRVGSAIAKIDTKYRDKDKIRETINKEAKENGLQYINEIKRFIFLDFNKIYESLNKNILSINELKSSCCSYNGVTDKECNGCDNTHIYCMLYKYGLIGIEERDLANDICKIKFELSGYQPSYSMKHTLPPSARYFIHPCFSEVIESYRKEKGLSYNYSRDIIVGYDKEVPCTIPLPEIVKVGDIEVSKYLVTMREYDLYCEMVHKNLPDDETWGRDNRPVINISWEEATEYARWLSRQTNQKYRLPTREEWESICGGKGKKWYFGDRESELDKYCWYNKNSSLKTHPVGEKEPNEYGIYDLHGNVWEWCQDSYEKEENHKILKGGAFDSNSNDTYIEVIGSANKSEAYNNVGFRLIKGSKSFKP